MANPFLVLGGIATGLVTAMVGVLIVPGWVASAHDAAAISDLAQVAAGQAAAMSSIGSYALTLDELETGEMEGVELGVRILPTVSVATTLVTDDAGTVWCAVAHSRSGAYFGRSDASPDTAQGATAAAAAANSDCAIEWPVDEPEDPPVGGGDPTTPPDPQPTEEPQPTPDPTETPVPEPEPTEEPEPENPWPPLEEWETPPGGVIRPGKHTIITGITWPVPVLGVSQPTCVIVDITGELDTPYPWSFEIERNGTPFYGEAPGSYWYDTRHQARFTGTADTITVSGVGDGRVWNADWSNRDLDSSRHFSIKACSTPDPPPTVRYGDRWYEVTQSDDGNWTKTKACVRLTAAGNIDPDAYPFRFGWAGRFDLREAKAHIEAAGRTVNYVGFSPSPSQNFQFRILTDPTSKPVQDRYDIETGTMLALHGAETKSIQACVYGY